MMRFKKIRWNQKEVMLKWTTESSGETHEHELTATQEPHADLDTALQALASDVLNVCELDAPLEDVRVQSVSLSFSETTGLRGAVVTALKPVAIANAPVVLNTPHLAEDGEQAKGVMPPGMWRRVLALEEEARLYIGGKRAPKAQLDVFASASETQAPDSEDDTLASLGATVKVGNDWLPATQENVSRAAGFVGDR